MSNTFSKQIDVQNAKLIYDTFGTYTSAGPNFYSFFMGGVSLPSGVGTNASRGGNNPFENASTLSGVNFYKTLNKKDISLVVPRIDWTQGTAYHPYRSSNQEMGGESFYAYNKINSIVYLCISDNTDNRYDLRGKSASSIRPTHESGIEKYADGYSWLPLYKIDWNLNLFLTSNWLPVPSIENFSNIPKSGTLETNSRQMCGTLYNTIGSCCLYHESYWHDSISGASGAGGTSYSPGSLYKSIITKCYECLEISERLGMDFEFSEGLSGSNDCFNFGASHGSACSCSITHQTNTEKIKSTSSLPSINNEKFQATLEDESSEKDGRIISVFFDATNLSIDDLTVTTNNPEITFTSSTGQNAVIRFTTYVDSYRKIIIKGIELVSAGSNYRDIQITSAEGLESRIEINIDAVDGIGVNPSELLGACNIMYNVQINSIEIENSVGTSQKIFKFYGLSKNVEIYGDTATQSNRKILGSDVREKAASIFYRATDKYDVFHLSATISSFVSDDNVRFEDNSSSGVGSTTAVSFKEISDSSDKKLEVLINPQTSITDRISQTSLVNNNEPGVIFSINDRELSPVIPGTGKIVYTKTNNTITLPDEGEPSQTLTFRIIKSYC